MSQEPISSFYEQFQKLQEEFAQSLSAKLEEIRQIWNIFQENSLPLETLKPLQKIVHNLAGSSAHFGFSQLGLVAKEWDQTLLVCFQQQKFTKEAQENCRRLLQQIEETALIFEPEISEQFFPKIEENVRPLNSNHSLIYLVEDDIQLSQYLRKQLHLVGYSVQLFSQVEELKKAMQLNSPELILMDIMFPEGELAGPQSIAELKETQNISCPIIFISSRDDINARLEAIRASGDAYLTKPIEIPLLLEKMQQLLSRSSYNESRILIVDDEESLAHYYAITLNSVGMKTLALTDPFQIMETIQTFQPHLILLDIYMPKCDGLELAQVLRQKPEMQNTPILFLSSNTDPEFPFEAIRLGGDAFLTKPIQAKQLLTLVKNRLNWLQKKEKTFFSEAFPSIEEPPSKPTSARKNAVSLENTLEEENQFCGLFGKSGLMQEAFQRLKLAAQSDVTVLITGESGTGKELAAKAIHQKSERRNQPFLAINCSALSESLLESELFGHVKGAFTGAIRDKVGLFQAAGKGTLFLDEIGDITPYLQLKLLRVIQEKEIRRVGDEQIIKINARLLTATHRHLKELITSGHFREDFYYRIHVFEIHLPPLRDRQEDIPLLLHYFVKKFSATFQKKILSIHTDALQKLLEYPWPGNVRELQNAIEHAFVSVQNSQITLAELPLEIRFFKKGSTFPTEAKQELTSEEQFERERIRSALKETQGNRTKAAKLLGFSRVTLWKKIQKFNLDI